MGKSVTSEVIRIDNARLSFPRLFEPKAFQEGQEKRFEAAFLLDTADKGNQATIKAINKEARRIAKETWPKLDKDGFDALWKCFGYANENPQKKKYDGYEDMFYLSSNRKESVGRPLVVDGTRGNSPLTAEDGKPYAGCYVNGTVSLWTQDNQYGKRINANLRGVQFLRAGEAFGVAAIDAEEEFDALEDVDEDDFLDTGGAKGSDGDDDDWDDDIPF